MHITDDEVLTLLRSARGDQAADEIRSLLADVEARLAAFRGDPDKAIGGKRGFVDQHRELSRRRVELALVLAGLESGGQEDGTIDESAIDAAAVRQLGLCGGPRLVAQLLDTARMVSNRCRQQADQAAARLATNVAWHRSGNGTAEQALEQLRREVTARRENEKRAADLTAAVENTTARLAELAPDAIGDEAGLRADLREGLGLAREADPEIASLEAALRDVDAKLGQLGLVRTTVAKAAKSVGVGRTGTDLLEQRDELAGRLSVREKALLGDTHDQAGAIVGKAATGDPEGLAELVAWIDRQPKAFDPSLRARIHDVCAAALATSPAAWLSIIS
jgi:hypothetical protein